MCSTARRARSPRPSRNGSRAESSSPISVSSRDPLSPCRSRPRSGESSLFTSCPEFRMLTDAQARSRRLTSSRSGCAGPVRPSSFATTRSSARAGAELCARFLHRVFSVQEVGSVGSIGPAPRRRSATAAAAWHGRTAPAAGRRDRGRTAMTTPRPRRTPAPSDLSQPKFTIHRHRGLLSTWEVTRRPARLLLCVHKTRSRRTPRWPPGSPARSSRSMECDTPRSAR